LIQPRRAAQATTAGAVKDRKPAMIPIQNARRSVTPELIELDPESESQRALRKFIMADRKTFSVKDWISIFFSSTALVLSFASFYFTNLRVEERVELRISRVGYAYEESNPLVFHGAFINSGNRNAFVLEANYLLTTGKDGRGVGIGSDVRVKSQTFPLLLPSKDIQIVEFSVPMEDALRSHDFGAFVDPWG
jgi:hypothetical protein